MPMVVDYKHPKSETRRGRLKEGYVGTLDTDVQTGILAGSKIRRLTPLECERLQGFPDNWTKYGSVFNKYQERETVEISDAQRYKMCGNAVTTNVIQAVFERIFLSEA